MFEIVCNLVLVCQDYVIQYKWIISKRYDTFANYH